MHGILWEPSDVGKYGLSFQQALEFCPALVLHYGDDQLVRAIYPVSMYKMLSASERADAQRVRECFRKALQAQHQQTSVTEPTA